MTGVVGVETPGRRLWRKVPIVKNCPGIDPLSDAVLLHDRVQDLDRRRSLLALHLEQAIADAWIAEGSRRDIARVLAVPPARVREILYRSGLDPDTEGHR